MSDIQKGGNLPGTKGHGGRPIPPGWEDPGVHKGHRIINESTKKQRRDSSKVSPYLTPARKVRKRK